MSAADRWTVEAYLVLRGDIPFPTQVQVVATFDTAREAEAWLNTYPDAVADACTVVLVGVLASKPRRLRYTRDVVTGRWGLDTANYYVLNESSRIVSGFEHGNDAIAWREKHEPTRFAWSVVTSGQADGTGLGWWNAPVERQHINASGDRIVATWFPDGDEVWVRIYQHRDAPVLGRQVQGAAELRLSGEKWRALGLIVDPDNSHPRGSVATDA